MKSLLTDMTNHRDEKKRALNIIWNASDDYSFHPEFKAYTEDGIADLYFNYIIGAVYKYFDYSLLKNYFNYLKTDSDYEFFENLFWIGLENSSYHKAKKERPVLKILRRLYSKRVLNGEMPPSERAILNEINKAHYQRVIGEKTNAEERVLKILHELEFDEQMDTNDIILKMDDIIKKYFKFKAGSYEVKFKESIKSKEPSPTDLLEKLEEEEEEKEEEKEDLGYYLMKDLIIESAETTRDYYFEQSKEFKNTQFNLHKFGGTKVNADRNYIHKYYGVSILPEHKIIALEKILCTDNHKKSRLHFTKGEFDQSLVNDADAAYFKKVAKKQRESNVNYYYDDYARNNNSIVNLTNKIRNIMLVNFEDSIIRSQSGKLDANKIWRNFHVNDNKVFNKNIKNDIGNITVDILLDSSASQWERQEIIATQGYIIAESLTRCQIPVKVYSFCSLRGYTILNFFRDYEECDKNDKIFDYRASGANRDGLAIRTALHMMENTQSENKILIVLSDCKPNDIEINPITGIMPTHTEYSGIKGVNDTAYEVKKGIMKGNKILCVFTGEDEDVISAKRIYGRNFVRINYLERFSDIVGVMLLNQLKNL